MSLVAEAPSRRPRLAPPEPDGSAVPAAIPPPARSLAGYVLAFDLKLETLRGRDVLDVGAGPSSFTAEARARRISAVAVDPLYDTDVESLLAHWGAPAGSIAAPRVALESSRVTLRGNGVELREEATATVGRFLADYAVHQRHGRYVCAALPTLPFFDGTFDTVLCGSRLFLADGAEDDWVLTATVELVRVAAEEVRIHVPVASGSRSSGVIGRLRREMKARGVASWFGPVGDETGGAHLLVLRKGVR